MKHLAILSLCAVLGAGCVESATDAAPAAKPPAAKAPAATAQTAEWIVYTFPG